MKFWEQVKGWEVWTFLICVFLLCLYIGRQIDFENMLKKDSPTPVHMGGKIQPSAKLTNVTVVDIPSYVYDSLPQDSKFKRYLTGNHKYILLFTYDGCPYARAYHQACRYAFDEQGFSAYYRKRIIHVGRSYWVSCPARMMNCASAWVTQQCFGKLCLINPQRKKVVVDASQNAEQLPALLEKYKEW